MNFKRPRRGIMVCCLTLFPAAVFADAVFWGCVYGEPQVLKSGQIACRQDVRECRKMVLSCSREDKPLFTADAFADSIAASDDGQYIVGLSNRGMVAPFWIRNSRGEVIEPKPQSPPMGIHYCAMSVTNIREWFNSKDPNVRFQFKEGKLAQVMVRGCDGKDVPLLK